MMEVTDSTNPLLLEKNSFSDDSKPLEYPDVNELDDLKDVCELLIVPGSDAIYVRREEIPTHLKDCLSFLIFQVFHPPKLVCT